MPPTVAPPPDVGLPPAIVLLLAGNDHFAQRSFVAAAESYRAALAIDPHLPAAHANLGSCHKELEDWTAAASCFRTAIILRPDYLRAYANCGVVYRSLAAFAPAERCLRRALSLAPTEAETQFHLASLAFEQKQAGLADTRLRRTLALAPALAVAHCLHGNLDAAADQPDRAVASYQRAIQILPDFAEAHHNRAIANYDRRAIDAAKRGFKIAQILQPHYPEAVFHDAVARLTEGDYGAGFAGYEWRLRGGVKSLAPVPLPRPIWTGEPLWRKTLLVHAEQGLGDCLQFCRFVMPLIVPEANILFEAPPPLVRLLQRMTRAPRLIASGRRRPDFDFHIPVMSLPAVLGTQLSDLPIASPYLTAEPSRVAAWRTRFPDRPGERKIGIVWTGNPSYPGNRKRSIPLAALAPLARLPGIRLVSLQRNHGLAELQSLPEGMIVETLDDDFDAGRDAFIDTAALMESLDLVISIDSAPLHLAGALGRPCWALLCHVPHWPWMLDREDTPWYPTMRLFRQANPGDWNRPIAAMVEALTLR